MDKENAIYLSATKIYDTQSSVVKLDNNWLDLSDGDEFLIGVKVAIYGALIVDSDEVDGYSEMEELVQKDKANKYFEIKGYIIHAEEAVDNGFDPYEVCDAYSGDLEMVYSTLLEHDMAISDISIRNVLYIDTCDWYINDLLIREKILDHLKGIIYELYHIRIDLISFYSAPNEDYEKKSILSNERRIAMNEKVSSLLDLNEDKENVINLNSHLYFSQEEINENLGRRNLGDTYPKEFINIEEFNSFTELGFRELGESRLLIMEV